MILFAVMASVMLLIMGLTIEGGRVFVEYRRMQAAADVAALTGAQDLPCKYGDTTCTSAADTLACNYAVKNGYACTPDQGNVNGVSSADTPPVSCSPYNGLPYGNADKYTNCSAVQTPPTQYYFTEVRLTKPLTIPIFNLTFNMYAHAVAKEGTFSPTDYAMVLLDSTMPAAFYKNGSGPLIIIGPTIVDSTSASAYTYNGGSTAEACDGQWYATSSQAAPGQLKSLAGGRPLFAQAGCSPTGTYDGSTAYFPNTYPVKDPYASTSLPTSANLSNCGPCQSTAYYYTWNCTSAGRASGTWHQATSALSFNGGCTEFFPGVYNGGISVRAGATQFFNPGVYTFTGGGYDSNGGNACIYGSPACDQLASGGNIPGQSQSCTTASFPPSGTTSSSAWLYYCSPWGIWDSYLSRTGAPGGGPSTTAPVFYTPAGGTVPLNGITFYFTPNTSYNMHGNGTNYLAYPNPCPGTGTGTTGSADFTTTYGSVNFTSNPLGEPSGATGANGGVYTYPSTALPKVDKISGGTSPTTAYVYPNVDLTLAGECGNTKLYANGTYAGDVWQGEMPIAQHLHFFIFARGTGTSSATNSTISFHGTGAQFYMGITYDVGLDGCGGACNVDMSGNKGSGGPPEYTGQIIADNASFQGASTVQLYYRPCQPPNPCGTGPGTSLVE